MHPFFTVTVHISGWVRVGWKSCVSFLRLSGHFCLYLSIFFSFPSPFLFGHRLFSGFFYLLFFLLFWPGHGNLTSRFFFCSIFSPPISFFFFSFSLSRLLRVLGWCMSPPRIYIALILSSIASSRVWGSCAIWSDPLSPFFPPTSSFFFPCRLIYLYLFFSPFVLSFLLLSLL